MALHEGLTRRGGPEDAYGRHLLGFDHMPCHGKNARTTLDAIAEEPGVTPLLLGSLEKAAGLEPVQAETQVLGGADQKRHLLYQLHHGDGRLLHVDLTTHATCLPSAAVAAKLAEIETLHANLPEPEGAGRAIGRK